MSFLVSDLDGRREDATIVSQKYALKGMSRFGTNAQSIPLLL